MHCKRNPGFCDSKRVRLPFKIFLRTFKYVPRVAVNLVIENKEGKILLARRAIPPLKGSWHMPGSFILKGESINECIERVASRELGLKVSLAKAKLLGAFDDIYKDPRGHVVDLVYKLTVSTQPKKTKETKEAAFFAKLPKNIGFNHKSTLQKLGY